MIIEFESIKIFMAFSVSVLAEMFFASPIAEIGEGNMSLCIIVFEEGFECGLWICQPDPPGCELAASVHELHFANSSFSINIQLLKLNPQMIVLS
jgi:hypothetical protein